jgi:hypothetical protein
MRVLLTITVGLLASFLIVYCSSSTKRTSEIARFPADDLHGLIAAENVEIDLQNTSDGKGSLRIIADKPTVVELYQIDDIDIQDALLVYQAELKTAGIDGQVYLEMWCHFPGLGEFFSRGLNDPLTGSTDWTSAATPFILKQGQNPDRVRLNLVIDGRGTAWVDNIRLLRSVA